MKKKTTLKIIAAILVIGAASLITVFLWNSAFTINNQEDFMLTESVSSSTITTTENGIWPTKVTIPPAIVTAKTEARTNETHVYYFIGKVISLGTSTIEVSQEKLNINTGLYDGNKGEVTLVKSTCSTQVKGKYSFKVTYAVTAETYTCESANSVDYGF